MKRLTKCDPKVFKSFPLPFSFSDGNFTHFTYVKGKCLETEKEVRQGLDTVSSIRSDKNQFEFKRLQGRIRKWAGQDGNGTETIFILRDLTGLGGKVWVPWKRAGLE